MQNLSTGVILWGPAGCGKSSIARKLSAKLNPMYFINTDKIVEIVTQLWCKDFYDRALFSDQENETHYWYARNMNFSEIGIDEKHVFDEIFKRLDIPVKCFSDSEFAAFKSKQRVSVITYAVVAFLIFLAKRRCHNFMKETNGLKFNARSVSDMFRGVQSILQIVYVSSVDTLIERVSHRNQANTPIPVIKLSYHKSYFDSFQDALKSHIFKEIVVTNNDLVPKTMIVLTKCEFKRGYIMEIKPTGALNEEEYDFIGGILANIGHGNPGRTDKSLHSHFPL